MSGKKTRQGIKPVMKQIVFRGTHQPKTGHIDEANIHTTCHSSSEMKEDFRWFQHLNRALIVAQVKRSINWPSKLEANLKQGLDSQPLGVKPMIFLNVLRQGIINQPKEYGDTP